VQLSAYNNIGKGTREGCQKYQLLLEGLFAKLAYKVVAMQLCNILIVQILADSSLLFHMVSIAQDVPVISKYIELKLSRLYNTMSLHKHQRTIYNKRDFEGNASFALYGFLY
jgi:hypothetical protein